MIYDYYDEEKWHEKVEEFFCIAMGHENLNNFLDIYLDFIELSKIKPEILKEFQIDERGYLYWLIKRYAKLSFSPIAKMKFLKHPYITKCRVDKKSRHIETLIGDVDFSLWVNGLSDSIRRSYKTRKEYPFMRALRDYNNVYIGNYDHRCHEAAIHFGYGANVVTAFMPHAISDLKYLHSFLEKENIVVDVSANLRMSSDDYYRLFEPEVVTDIPGPELFKTHEELKEVPGFAGTNIRKFLVEYYEIIENPEKVLTR